MKQTRADVSSGLLDQLELREMRETDRHFVLSSWVRSFASKSSDARDYEGPARGLFSADYAPVVRALVARSTILVACLKDEPDTVIGWLAVEGDALHYALVKPRWRRLGVAAWMLKDYAALAVVTTHRTSDALKCPIPAGWIYRRFRIWPATETAS
jgi:GNAT superfamily N-acetyltransferase